MRNIVSDISKQLFIYTTEHSHARLQLEDIQLLSRLVNLIAKILHNRTVRFHPSYLEGMAILLDQVAKSPAHGVESDAQLVSELCLG